LSEPNARCGNCGLSADDASTSSRRKRELRVGVVLMVFSLSVALVIAIAAPFLKSI